MDIKQMKSAMAFLMIVGIGLLGVSIWSKIHYIYGIQVTETAPVYDLPLATGCIIIVISASAFFVNLENKSHTSIITVIIAAILVLSIAAVGLSADAVANINVVIALLHGVNVPSYPYVIRLKVLLGVNIFAVFAEIITLSCAYSFQRSQPNFVGVQLGNPVVASPYPTVAVSYPPAAMSYPPGATSYPQAPPYATSPPSYAQNNQQNFPQFK